MSGLSRDRLHRLTDNMRGYVERGEVPGLITAIYRKGEQAHCDILGSADFEGRPLGYDSIFRIGSLSKPMTAVAALTFVEEGKLRLGDRIDKWMPEFEGQKVIRDPLGPIEDSYLTPQPITVEHLLTHRPGFVTALVPQGPLGKAAVQTLMGGLSKRPDITSDEWIARLAALPLAYPPGERVIYGFATDVLGVLLSRIAGKPLPDVLRERVFEPLGMVDTGFFVPPEKISRFTTAYNIRWMSNRRVAADTPEQSSWAAMPRFPAAGTGLVSTTPDCMRFGRMLLGGGILDGERILSRPTVQLMTTNFLTPEHRRVPFFGTDYWTDRGLGLSVYVLDNIVRHQAPASLGQYGWGGAYGTTWFNAPAEDLTALLMIQVNWPSVTPPILAEFESLVYQAIDD